MQKPEKQEELKVLCRLKTVESPRCLSHPGTTGATQPALQELSEKHLLFCFHCKPKSARLHLKLSGGAVAGAWLLPREAAVNC